VSLIISVIGTGYLGVVHAACMADLGHTVVAIDTDAAKVDSLSRGVAPMFEPGLEKLLGKVLPTGRLRFTTDYTHVAGADVHFICVGTPQRKGENAADTSHVFAAAHSLAPYLREQALVVGKSTVPVGTAAQLRDRLQAGAPVGVRVRLAWNPEFLPPVSSGLIPGHFGCSPPRRPCEVRLADPSSGDELSRPGGRTRSLSCLAFGSDKRFSGSAGQRRSGRICDDRAPVVDDLPSPGRHLPDGCSAGEALILAQQVRQEVGVR
jgi:hypothetical protein